MEHLYEKASASAAYLKEQLRFAPRIAVVLGSGLGDLTGRLYRHAGDPLRRHPPFPPVHGGGPQGALLEGKLGDTPCCHGRALPLLEGYTMKEVCYPFYVFKLLGIETVVLTTPPAASTAASSRAALMLITDTINMMGTNPLIGPNDERFGPRFPDMTEIFSHDLLDLARSVADRQGIAYREGVYMGFMGPCYETAAEIRAFAALGADAVGMSTVPERWSCAYLGIKVLAVSCITNMATGIQTVRHSHARVLEIANQAGDRMCRWLAKSSRRCRKRPGLFSPPCPSGGGAFLRRAQPDKKRGLVFSRKRWVL